MRLNDALFNWLQMHVVAQARPDDNAAVETLDFFSTILHEDHRLSDVQVILASGEYVITYVQDDSAQSQTYEQEHVEQLLADIRSNPKYN